MLVQSTSKVSFTSDGEVKSNCKLKPLNLGFSFLVIFSIRNTDLNSLILF
jgi:hypothetical protein